MLTFPWFCVKIREQYGNKGKIMQVFYFSRSGNSQRIAEEIAAAHQISALPIDDGQNWKGVGKFLKAGAMASKKEILEVEHEAIVQNGPIILVFPVWAGSLPPAVRGFLEKAKTNPITGVALSAATSIKEEEQMKFSPFYEVKGKELHAPQDLIKR